MTRITSRQLLPLSKLIPLPHRVILNLIQNPAPLPLYLLLLAFRNSYLASAFVSGSLFPAFASACGLQLVLAFKLKITIHKSQIKNLLNTIPRRRPFHPVLKSKSECVTNEHVDRFHHAVILTVKY